MWHSAILNNLLIFVLGSLFPALLLRFCSELSLGAILASLGFSLWQSTSSFHFIFFSAGHSGDKCVDGSKGGRGVAEKRKGRRGPGSVVGSSVTGCVCAFVTIFLGGGRHIYGSGI